MDKIFMKKAIDLAIKGTGFASPNPLVGALIVKNDQIIGQGYHECFGKNHAEINAIQNSKDDILNSTMYVTLEPCAMCAGALYWSQISRIVFAASDEHRGYRVMGGKLHPKTQVTSGILQEEASELIRKFFVRKRNMN